MSVLVRDAIMEPVRKCQDATHFKITSAHNTKGELRNDMLTPCSPGDADAQRMDLMDVDRFVFASCYMLLRLTRF